MNRLKGSITLTHLIGWGISISIALGGFFWAKIAQTDGALADVKTVQASVLERTATVEEAIRTIKQDNTEIKSDVKELLRRTK